MARIAGVDLRLDKRIEIALTDIYGVAAASAIGFAFGWHLGGFIPITLMGLWYARRIGLSMRDLRGSAREPASASRAHGHEQAVP